MGPDPDTLSNDTMSKDSGTLSNDSGNGKGTDSVDEALPSAGIVHPRAVRVRLSAASRNGDDPVLIVSPVSEPVRTSQTIDRGSLDGVAAPDVEAAQLRAGGTGQDDPAVLAQRRAVAVDGVPADAALRVAGSGRYVLSGDGAVTRVILGSSSPAEGGVRRREVLVDGFRFEVETESERIAALRERATRGRAAAARAGTLEVRAVIPGKVAAVSVAAGDGVVAGQQILVVEAMKMQNELRAPRDGTILRVGVAPGASIEVGDLLVVIS